MTTRAAVAGKEYCGRAGSAAPRTRWGFVRSTETTVDAALARGLNAHG